MIIFGDDEKILRLIIDDELIMERLDNDHVLVDTMSLV